MLVVLVNTKKVKEELFLESVVTGRPCSSLARQQPSLSCDSASLEPSKRIFRLKSDGDRDADEMCGCFQQILLVNLRFSPF